MFLVVIAFVIYKIIRQVLCILFPFSTCSLPLENHTLWTPSQNCCTEKLSHFLLLDTTLDPMHYLHFKAFHSACVLDFFPSSWSNKMKITKPVRGAVHKSCWGPGVCFYHHITSIVEELIWSGCVSVLSDLKTEYKCFDKLPSCVYFKEHCGWYSPWCLYTASVACWLSQTFILSSTNYFCSLKRQTATQ